jgi:hypothetical protein
MFGAFPIRFPRTQRPARALMSLALAVLALAGFMLMPLHPVRQGSALAAVQMAVPATPCHETDTEHADPAALEGHHHADPARLAAATPAHHGKGMGQGPFAGACSACCLTLAAFTVPLPSPSLLMAFAAAAETHAAGRDPEPVAPPPRSLS